MLPLALLAASTLALLSAPLVGQNEVKWYQGTFDEALQLAADRPAKLLFVYVWNDATDAAFYTQSLQSQPVVKALGDYVCFSADGANDAGRAVFTRYGLTKGPVVLMLRPDGKVEDALSGFYNSADLIAELARIRAGEGTLAVVREAAAAKPNDLELQFKLATKLRTCGDTEGYLKILATIKAADPKAKTEIGAMVQFNEIVDATFAPAISPDNVKLKPLTSFLTKQKNKRVRFLGYDRIAAAEQRRGNLKAAIAAVRRCWKVCPDDEVMDWGNRIAAEAWKLRKELSKSELKLALQIAKKAVKKAEAIDQNSIPNYRQFLAWRLYTLAANFYMNSKRKEAIATMQRAVTLAPEQDLKAVLEGFKAGHIDK